MKSTLQILLLLILSGFYIFFLMFYISHRTDTVMTGYKEIHCDNIVPKDNKLVCEVYMDQEDDNLRIFKGEYGK